MGFWDKVKETSGPVTAFGAVAAVGVTGGYYTANSENAALERDLSLATNGRGILESVETIERLSDAAENVFRFEEHAPELGYFAICVGGLVSGHARHPPDVVV